MKITQNRLTFQHCERSEHLSTKVCHIYEGLSQLWRYVTVMKVCHSYEGMSHLCWIFKAKNLNETILMTFKNYCESIWRKSQETFFNIHLKNTNRALFSFFVPKFTFPTSGKAKAFKIQARISEKSKWKAQNITDWTSLHFKKRQNECQKVWISTFKQRVKTTFFWAYLGRSKGCVLYISYALFSAFFLGYLKPIISWRIAEVKCFDFWLFIQPNQHGEIRYSQKYFHFCHLLIGSSINEFMRLRGAIRR